jgi:hypothetical protein
MKKTIFCLAIVTLLMLGLSSQGFCMSNRPPAPKKSTTKQVEPILRISGKVVGYNWTSSIITISPMNGTSITIEIDKVTNISKTGKLIKMVDIKTGDMVIVDYEIKGGKKIAKVIVVQEKVSPKGAIPEKKKR